MSAAEHAPHELQTYDPLTQALAFMSAGGS